jgi:hypothetical protein
LGGLIPAAEQYDYPFSLMEIKQPNHMDRVCTHTASKYLFPPGRFQFRGHRFPFGGFGFDCGGGFVQQRCCGFGFFAAFYQDNFGQGRRCPAAGFFKKNILSPLFRDIFSLIPSGMVIEKIAHNKQKIILNNTSAQRLRE